MHDATSGAAAALAVTLVIILLVAVGALGVACRVQRFLKRGLGRFVADRVARLSSELRGPAGADGATGAAGAAGVPGTNGAGTVIPFYSGADGIDPGTSGGIPEVTVIGAGTYLQDVVPGQFTDPTQGYLGYIDGLAITTPIASTLSTLAVSFRNINDTGTGADVTLTVQVYTSEPTVSAYTPGPSFTVLIPAGSTNQSAPNTGELPSIDLLLPIGTRVVIGIYSVADTGGNEFSVSGSYRLI